MLFIQQENQINFVVIIFLSINNYIKYLNETIPIIVMNIIFIPRQILLYEY